MAADNDRLRGLLRRWVRLEREVLPAEDLAGLCRDTRAVLREQADGGVVDLASVRRLPESGGGQEYLPADRGFAEGSPP